MSKMRIYELAKELGVENKVIISKAKEVGIGGKTSHSHSLEGDEADQIRRAIIRQAIGSKPESEKVKTRVNKETGATDTLVEKRKGNVIRRRRKGPEAEAEVAAEDDSVIHLDAVASVQESRQEEAKPVFDGDALFKEEEPDADERAEEQAEKAQPEEVQQEASAAEQLSEVEAEEISESQAAAREKDKEKAGPRVLGRMELPQKKVPAAVERPTNGAGAFEAAEEVEESDEDKDKRKGGKKRIQKRGRKREFSRGDLVDYEGGGLKRGGRAGARGGMSRRDSRDDGSSAQTQATTPKASKRVVRIDESLTVGDLAKQMSLKAGDVISKLMELGVMATINQLLDQDTATIVAEEFEYQVESVSFDETEILETEKEEDPANLVTRPPVVTVMGHVDHGKTSLLDSIRSSTVAAKEHGGITQHIGAYSVKVSDGRLVTFIDTPGHAAFTTMRARGAQVTDLVILVVAADDGVMPQTIEAINHAKAADVPIIVAVNKMDKVGANPDRVRQQLSEHGLQPEDWGGDTIFAPVSALKGEGLDGLLESVLLVAELKELKANPDRKAKGAIIESRQEVGRGTVATVLVQNGTLKIGDIFVTGAEYGRVRQMIDYTGKKVESAGPSMPVEITGLNSAPSAGDDFMVVDSEAKAKQVAGNRSQKKFAREQLASGGGPISLEEFSRRAQSEDAAELNIILKADVHGSVEAAREAIEKLSTDKVRVKVLHSAVGGVNESDVQLAVASKAIIIGFNVRAEQRALGEADSRGVELLFYRVIYDLIDNVRSAMEGLLDPLKEEVRLGTVEVRETYTIPKIGTVAGCYVSTGTIRRGALTRILRDSKVVHEGKMAGLRRFKDDVKEVQSGYECGISLEGFNDIKSGDVLEVYEVKEIAQKLEH